MTIGPQLIFLPEAGSTNAVMRGLAQNGAPHGTAVVADSQTEGRGRAGRTFFSPPGGLYMSVALRKERLPHELSAATLRAAVAACEAIERVCNKSPSVKWVNDIMLDGKKIGGILAESAGSYVILGVGINLCAGKADFPDEIRETAGSLYGCAPPPDVRDRLATEIVSLTHAQESEQNAAIIAKYRKRLPMLGRRISVRQGSRIFFAEALDVKDDGRLEVAIEDGQIELLDYGDVTVRTL